MGTMAFLLGRSGSACSGPLRLWGLDVAADYLLTILVHGLISCSSK
jgi:hypothetical protein